MLKQKAVNACMVYLSMKEVSDELFIVLLS